MSARNWQVECSCCNVPGAETSCGDDQIARVDAGDPIGISFFRESVASQKLGEFQHME